MGGVISNVVQQQIVEDAISLPETSVSCNLDNSLEIRYGKRARDVNEVSSWVDPVPVPPDIRSPLPKRKRERYKIKGRRPIRSVRNRKSEITSPRGVSSETQFFSQGSLTVGDTVLPLPARAYPEVPLAPDEWQFLFLSLFLYVILKISLKRIVQKSRFYDSNDLRCKNHGDENL